MDGISFCHEVGCFWYIQVMFVGHEEYIGLSWNKVCWYINGMGFVHGLYVFGPLMVCVWGRWCNAQLYIPNGIKGNPRGRGGKGGPEGLPW